MLGSSHAKFSGSWSLKYPKRVIHHFCKHLSQREGEMNLMKYIARRNADARRKIGLPLSLGWDEVYWRSWLGQTTESLLSLRKNLGWFLISSLQFERSHLSIFTGGACGHEGN